MKQPALFKRLSDVARASISLADLGASYVEISVQPDRTVVQLSFRPLPNPFEKEAALTVVERIKTQLLTGAFSTDEFSALTYTPKDLQRLWLFISDDYGMGSIPVCNFCNGRFEWNVRQ